MPRLPSAKDLGRPVGRAAGGVIGISPAAIGPPRQSTELEARALTQVGRDISTTGEFLSGLMQREQERIDVLRADDALNQLKLVSQDLTRGKQNGFTNLVGGEAAKTDILKEWSGKYNEGAAGIESRLDNERQKQLFRAAASPTSLEFKKRILVHQAKQSEVYEKEVFDATLTTEKSNAIAFFNDPRAISNAIGRMNAAIENFADQNGMPPEWIASQKAAAKSAVVVGITRQLLLNDPEMAGGYFEDNKDQLTGQDQITLGGEVRQAELQREARRFSALVGMVKDAEFVLGRGKTPPAIEALRDAIKEIPELKARIDLAMRHRDSFSKFSVLTPIDQQNSINEINTRIAAGGGQATRTQLELADGFEALHADTVQGLKNDPVSFAASVGLINVPPLDVNSPDTFAARSGASQLIFEHYGIETHGFTSDEILAIEDRIQQGDAADKLQLAGVMRGTMSDRQYGAFMNDVSKNNPTFAMAGTLALEAPKLAFEVLRGQEIMNDPELKAGIPTSTIYLPAAQSKLGDAFQHDPGAMSQVITSALAVDAIRRHNKGEFRRDDFDEADFEDIIDEIVGGVLEWNDTKIIAPTRDMTETEFEDFMDGIDDFDLMQAGNTIPTMPNGEVVQAETIRQYGHLESIGQGLFLVNINGFYVKAGSTTEPYEFDFNVVRARAARRLSLAAVGPPGLSALIRHSQQNIKSGNAIKNADGSISSILSISVETDRLNGGQPTLIPTIWGGKKLGARESIDRAVKSGKDWPFFRTRAQADRASRALSKQLG